jgi:serine protease Do
MEMTMSDNNKPWPAVRVRAAGATKSKLKAGLLASAAAAALFAGAVHSLRAESPELKAAAGLSLSAQATTNTQSPGFADLVAAVKPAVVSVRVKADVAQQLPPNDNGANPFEGTPFEKFFRDFRGRSGKGMPAPNGNGRHGFVQGQGSGFFVSADGYIVTNHHVVDNAITVQVVTEKGSTLDAKVIGTDPKTDLALIKVDGGTDFPFVKLAGIMPRVGEWVVAMGNPFGLDGTVTAGIVSAHGRDIGAGPYDDFLQIDAPVNRGNSGGPTFNTRGEVVGVNTAIYSPSGGSVGIAFAIPATTVKTIVDQLKMHGHVDRGWLGAQIQAVSADIADSLGLDRAKGALIIEAQTESPAAKAGLKSGDVIIRVDGAQVQDSRDLARKVAENGPNKTVDLTIVRDGKEQTVPVKLGQASDERVRKASVSENEGSGLAPLGLRIAPASQVEGSGSKGLAVVGVDANSKAAELGFQEGDVILKAGGKDLSRPDELRAAMSRAMSAGMKNTLVLVKRGSAMSYMAVPVAKG